MFNVLDQICLADRSIAHVQIGDAYAGRATNAARGMAGRLQAQLPGRGAFHQPLGQTAIADQFCLGCRQAFAVKSLGPETAFAMGTVDDVHGAVEQLGIERVEQKAGFAGDGTAGNCADKMAEQAIADTGIIDDRHRARFEIHRIEPGNGAFACFPTDIFGVFEIFEKTDAIIGIVAFHAIALSGNDTRRQAVTAGRISAGEAMAGRQGNNAASGAGAAAFAIGNAFDRSSRVLCL